MKTFRLAKLISIKHIFVMFAFFTSLLLFCNQAECADWTSPLIIVNPVPYWTGDNPSIAVDSEGEWHVFYGWVDDDGPPNTPYISYINSKGETGNILSDNSVSHPSVAIDNNGVFHVVFRATRGSIQYINNQNGEWSIPQTLVNPVPYWTGDNPSIAVDSEGEWHVFYGWVDDDGPPNTPYISYINSKGETGNILSDNSVSHPSVAIDSC
jgi:hypothetical protein